MGGDGSVLRERDEELVALGASARRLAAGVGATVVVIGEGGIGKTSLLAAGATLVEGATVLRARGSELEATHPYGAVRQLLERTVRAASPERRERWLSGAAGAVVGLLDGSAAGDVDAFAVQHGAYWLVAELADERPVVLVVDDLQWVDEPSLGVLAYVARRVSDLPVLVLLATRPMREDPSVAFGAIVTDPDAVRLLPRALSPAGVSAVLGDRLGAEVHPAMAAAGAEATGGNPFLLSELATELRHRGLAPDLDAAAAVASLAPSAVATAVLTRLGALGAVPRQVAHALAVLGDDPPLDVVGALAGTTPAAVAEAAAQLGQQGILAPDALHYAHPMVRTAVRQSMGIGARQAAHAAAAELLRRRAAPVGEVAAHLLLTAPAGDPGVVELLRAAAAASLAMGAPQVAAAHLQRALAEPPPPTTLGSVVQELGRAEAKLGRPTAVEHLRRAVALAEDPATRAVAVLELARERKFSGPDGAREAVELLSPVIADGGAAAETTDLELELVGLAYASVEARRRIADRGALLEALAGASPATARFADACAAMDLAAAGTDRSRALALVDRALGATDAPLDPTTALGYGSLLASVACLWLDHLGPAVRHTTAMFEDARRRGDTVALVTAAHQRALTRYHLGDLAAAEADAELALQLGAGLPAPPSLIAAAEATHLLVRLERSSTAAELEVLLPPHRADVLDLDALPACLLLHGRGLVRLALDDPEGALHDLLAAGEQARSWDAAQPVVVPWRADAARALARLGRLAEAAELAHEERRQAEASGAPRAIGVAWRAVAACVPESSAVELLAEAVAVLDASPSALERARAQVELGMALRRSGRAVDAREALRVGLDQAQRCGATRLAAQAHDELLASGGRPRRVAVSGGDALTPQERRVAERAAAGSSNRAIAQELYISEKTVEGHLSRAYDKLGVRARSKLAGALAG